MKETWAKIDAWLKENAPVAYASLRAGATQDALDKMEQQLGMTLPAELREYLAIHDGQEASSLCGLLDGWIFLSSESIVEAHKTFGQLLEGGDFDGQEAFSDGRVKAIWWSNGWVPFLESPGGDYLCFDMDPVKDSDKGQIITFRHDYGERDVYARRLSTALKTFLSDLKHDHYEVKRRGGLWPA